jgi:hypothetical protein
VLLLSWLSGGPPGRLPMAGCGVVEGGSEGEGDLGRGGEDRSGASTGGSSTAVVLCEGVWLRVEAWVTVGEAAAMVSQFGCHLIVQSALIRVQAIGHQHR